MRAGDHAWDPRQHGGAARRDHRPGPPGEDDAPLPGHLGGPIVLAFGTGDNESDLKGDMQESEGVKAPSP